MKTLVACALFVVAAGTAALARIDISVPGATSTPPPPGPLATTFLPTPTQTTLPNGLRVIAVHTGDVPLVTAELSSTTGSAADPAGRHGVAALAARIMLEGTATRDARAIAAATDALGAQLTAIPGADSTSVSVNATTDKFPAALALMADVVRNPTFAPDEVERARKNVLADLLQAYGNTETLASIAITRALYGEAGYGNPLAGTPAAAAAITRADLVAFHQSAFRPDAAILVIGGDMDARSAFGLAQRTFGTWSKPATPAPTTPLASAAPAPRFIVIDKPDAGAGVVAAGFRTFARTSPEYAAGAMANAVLDGYSGRLNTEVRVKRGLAYGAASAFTALGTDGSLVARTLSVENPKIPQAADVVLATLRNLAASPVAQTELDARRMATLGNRAYSLQTQRGVVQALGTYARYGLPLAAINTEAGEDLAVSPENVHAFSHEYLRVPTVVVIGNASAFLPALRAKYPTLDVIRFDRLDLDSPTLTARVKKAASAGVVNRR